MVFGLLQWLFDVWDRCQRKGAIIGSYYLCGGLEISNYVHHTATANLALGC